MSDIIQRVSAWKVAMAKCAMLVFISVGTFLVSSMQNWNAEYVDNLQWYHWAGTIIAALVIGCTTVNSFIDKTFHTEGMKIAFDESVRVEQAKADNKIEAIKQEVTEVKADAAVAVAEAKAEKDKVV